MDYNIKRHEEIRQLTTGKGERYVIAYLFDYEYIKSYYRLIVVDLTRKKDFYTDPTAVQQIEFVEQLKELDNTNANAEHMFILTILEETKETTLNFSQKSVTEL